MVANQRRRGPTRQQVLGFLTANCKCQGNANATSKLGSLPNQQLAKMAMNLSQALRLLKTHNTLSRVRNQEAEGEGEGPPPIDVAGLAEFFGIAIDPASDPVGFMNELTAKLDEVRAKLSPPAPAEPPAEPAAVASRRARNQGDVGGGDCPEGQIMGADGKCAAPAAAARRRPNGRAMNSVPRRRMLTDQEWLQSAPPRVRQAVINSMRVEHREKVNLIRRLISNVRDRGRRQQLADKYMKKSLGELREMVSLFPIDAALNVLAGISPPLYDGAGGGPVRLSANEQADVLDIEGARKDYPKVNRRGVVESA